MPATNCSLGAFTGCSTICWSVTGCTRAKTGTWMYVPTEGGSGVQLVPRPHSHNPPTHTPTVEGPCYRPQVAVFGHCGGGSAKLAT